MKRLTRITFVALLLICICVALALLTGCDRAGNRGSDSAGAASEQATLETLGFLDTGPLLLAADGTEFHSGIRAGLTVVHVPADVEFDVGDSSWTVFPTMDSAYDFRFTRTLDDREFHVGLYALNAEGDSQAFRWRTDAPHPEISEAVNPNPEGSVLLITVYSGAPFIWMPPTHAPDAGWNKAAIDARGHLWIYPDPEPAVALDTGEAIDTSVMREIEWWPVRMPYPDLITLCGTEPECVITSKGGMYLPFSMAGELTCTPTSRPSVVTVSGTRGDLTLEFDLWKDISVSVMTCAEALGPPHFGDELPLAIEARAREASTGRLLDLVATADGKLYVGYSTPHLQCPPCAAGFG